MISRLDSVGNPTGEKISTKVSSKSGGFEFQIPEQWDDSNDASVKYYIEVKGKAFDESSGTQSNTSISLSAITQNINSNSVNLLTHWSAERTKKLLTEGKSFSLSLKQANDELKKIFSIGQVNRLDISSSQFAADNAMLLLLSGALMEVAQAHEVEPQLLIDEISDDFADNGELSASGDHWFLRMQAKIRDNPSAYANKYSKLLKEKQGVDTVSISALPIDFSLASRPVANVPSEFFASPSETIVLDGSASHDSGNIINFTWFRVDQQTQYPVPVSDRFATSPTITVPSEAEVLAAPNQEIALLYALVVTDEDKLTHTGVVKVIVKKPPVNNTPPLAEPQQLTTDEDTPLKIKLAGSDADGDPIAFNLNTPLSLAHGILELDPDLGSVLPNVVYTPTKDYFGFDSFTFFVNDSFEISNIATVDIQVNPVNDPPIADAGADETAESLQAVSLNGSGTDVDGTIEAYLWEQTSGSLVSLSDSSVSNPSFTTPGVSSVTETLSFDLIVTDNDGADSIADTVDILVNPLNEAPVANAGIDQDVISVELVTLNGSGTDVDGTVVGYLWAQSNGSVVSLSNTSVANPDFTAPTVLSAPETLTFDLIVTDDDGAQSIIDSVNVVVNPPVNNKPVANAGPDQTITSIRTNLGSGFIESTPQIILDGSSSSDTEDTTSSLTFNWTQVSGPVSIDPDNIIMPTMNINGILNQDIDGDYVFRLVVTDTGGLASDSDEVTITVSPTSTNLPPTADDLSVPIDLLGYPTLITLMGNDPDGSNANLVYELVSLPSNGTLNASIGTLVGNDLEYVPNSISAPDPDSFTYRVRDELGLPSNLATASLSVPNIPPAAIATLNQQPPFNEGTQLQLIGGESFDQDGTIISYLWEQIGLPTVILSDPADPNPTFTLPGVTSAPLVLNFRLTVTDNDGAVSTDTIDIPVNGQPIATPQDVTLEFSTLDIVLSGTDPEGGALTYKIVTLPTNGTISGISVNVPFTSPTITYIPGNTPVADSFTFAIIDEEGFESTPATVNILVGNSPPTANPQQVVLDVDVSTIITFNLTGSDPDGDSFTFEIVEVLTPPNAYSFTQGTNFINDGEVTFEMFDFSGDFNFTFKVIDEHGLSSNIATVSIMVGNNPPNATTQSLIIPSVNGLEVDLHNYSSDPDGDVITFELVGTPVENTLNIIFSPTFATDGIATFVPLDTPASGSFQYKVIDEHGDESSIGTISASTP